MSSGDLTSVERELQAVAEARAQLSRLRSQERQARGDVGAATAALEQATELRADEAADVARLESWSPTRIWAGLRGSREAELSREAAELQAAEYAVAGAEQRRDAAIGALQQVQVSIQALGDLDERYEQALADKERLLVDHEIGASGELVEIAERLGQLAAEAKEIEEADAAGQDAFAQLDAAVALLESAHDWATWDTFGGGGMITDMVKYDRMDQASAMLRESDVRLRRLRLELADVDLSGVPDVAVDRLLQTFDVWFDNIFSDWSVRSRIGEALEAASRARHDVQQVAGVLRGRRSEVTSESERLSARRAEILTGE